MWHLVSVIVLAGLTWFEWGWLAFNRGFHAETNWLVFTRNAKVVDQFLYDDPSRPFLLLPFGLAHLINPESMTTANLVIAGYVLVMALLTYWFAFRLLNGSILGGLVAASIALTFGADQASALFSMVILWQVMIGVLCAALALRASLLNGLTFSRALACVLGAALALWTYEASAVPLLALLALPLALPRRPVKQLVIASAPLIGVLVFFGAMTLSRLQSGVAYYQANKFTGIPSLDDGFGRVTTWLGRALTPWTWGAPWEDGYFSRCVAAGADFLTTPVILAAIGWLIVAGTVALATRRRDIMRAGMAVRTLLFGIIFLAATYAPYLFVSDGQGHWRTHMMAQPAWGLVIATVVVALGQYGSIILGLLVAACAALVGVGLWANEWGQLENAARWSKVRTVMEDVTNAVPWARPGTSIILTNVGAPVTTLCKEAPAPDPFGDPSWFNSALALYYPSGGVEGLYIRRPGGPDTGIRFTRSGVASGTTTRKWADVIVLKVDGQGRASLIRANELPVGWPGYRPGARILPSTGHDTRMRAAFALKPDNLP